MTEAGAEMRNELCRRFETEFPIYAFTHCRDAVVAVSNAGRLGVLGAVGFSVEQLEIDIVLPNKHQGAGRWISRR